MYRCSICGTEVRMTAANDEVPEPPRHCLEDMDLVAPIQWTNLDRSSSTACGPDLGRVTAM